MANLILINQDGSYNYWSFVQYNQFGTIIVEEKWTLIGTSSQINHKKPMLCIDTFKSENGVYKERQRAKVFNASIDKLIFPVPESKMAEIPQYDKKKWDKIVQKHTKTEE